MPLPVVLVVKKGSIARLSVSSSMPTPLSLTDSGDHRAALARRSWRAVRMVSTPPSGMASRALTAMLSRADSSWARSASTVQASSASSVVDLDPLAQRAVEQVGHAADQRR